MHAYRPTQGPHRTRILYVFRSPAGSRIGREPLEGEVQEALEHTHPDLTFDWQSLMRESMEPARRPPGRGEPTERPSRPDRSSAGSRARQQEERAPERTRAPERAHVPEPPPAAADDDASMLGQTLGAGPAARLRARYAEVLQRIARRSRSPEERDRLVERARRLNPDDWADEAAVRAAVSTVEVDWQALVGELPARRRGRRGGRRRGQARDSATGVPAAPGEPDSQASGIIEGAGSNDTEEHERANQPDSTDDAGRDGDGVGAGPAAGSADAEPPGDLPDDD